MKIAFSMAQMRGGGAERVVSELANFFAKEGHDVSIMLAKESGCVYELEQNVKLIDLVNYNKGFVSRVKAIRKCIKDSNFDVVISFLTNANIETIIAAMGIKAPVIISERNNPYVDPNERIYRVLRKLTYCFADGYVFQTPDARDFFSRRIKKKSTVIMNPINPHLPERHEGEREKRIVNVGRLVKQKNQKLFIDAFYEFYLTHPEYTAQIYGDGPLEKELKEYISEKNMDNSIKLCGFSKTILSDIQKAAMFVMTSDYEGMSNALIEAVGMGVPSISTDHPIGGARMTINDGENGFLVPVGDARSITEKMSVIADNQAFAEQISENGVKLREKLSVDEIATQWLNYISIVKKS